LSGWFASLALLNALILGVGVSYPQAQHQSGKPKAIEIKAPEFPPIAHAAHSFGTVEIEIEIGQQGDVVTAHATSGPPLLRGVSVNAARQWRFEPIPENLKTNLLFDFVESGLADISTSTSHCRDGFLVIDPYHLKIYGYKKVGPLREVEDDVPKEFEGTFCKVHHERLRRDRVTIIYGLTTSRPGYLRAEQDLFPNANSEAFGGCVIETKLDPCTGTEVQLSPKYAEVLFCPACRRAEQRWSKTHPWPKPKSNDAK
jgi:hypothetical protein